MLEVLNLHHRYAGQSSEALAGVSVVAHAGRITGLLGPNGAGKSTLMALASGLLRVQRGEVRIGGEPLARALARRPPPFVLAPQSDAFYPMLSVQHNLECFAAALGLAGAAARGAIGQALARVQLERLAAQRAGTLSGGQRRRLNLAIALLTPAPLLLLDEPTAGVDPQSRALLHRSLREFAAAGAAVLFSSHLMSEVEVLAHDVVVLDGGRVLRSGALAEFLAERVLRFRCAGAARTAAPAASSAEPPAASPTEPAPASRAELAALLQPWGTLQLAGAEFALHLHGHAGADAPLAALAALRGAGVPLSAAHFGRASLEQAFIGLTSEALRDE